MDPSGKTRFEQRLDQIINSPSDVESALDELDNEDNVRDSLPTTVEYTQVPSVYSEDESINKDKIDDYIYARNTMRGLIERGQVALEGALIIARESEHPRAFEVSATIMRNISDMAEKLLTLQDGLKGPTPKAAPGKQINIQQNNYGVGVENSPDDISKLLDDMDE